MVLLEDIKEVKKELRQDSKQELYKGITAPSGGFLGKNKMSSLERKSLLRQQFQSVLLDLESQKQNLQPGPW